MSALSSVSAIRVEASDIGAKPAQTISEKIRICGSACLHVFDSNLFPWIRRGDLAFVRRFDFENLSAGDVILTECEGRLFLERVIREFPGARAGNASYCVVTKSVDSTARERRVQPDQFVGKVIRIHRRRKHIDLESARQVILGRLLARIARVAEFACAPFRIASRAS